MLLTIIAPKKEIFLNNNLCLAICISYCSTLSELAV